MSLTTDQHPLPHRDLVSVIVASYNHADFLPQRMESLLSQSYEKLEILVIDDCSPDASVQVLRGYVYDDRVRLIERPVNGGWVRVSNQGIESSTGKYILLANCDDACESEMIARLVTALELNPTAGVAFCRSLMTDEKGRVIGDDFSIRSTAFRERCASDTLLDGREACRLLLDSCIIPNLSAALFRRSTFHAVGLFSDNYRVCCDWDLFFRVASRFDIAYVAQPLNHFRQHARTIRSSTRDRIVYDEYFRLLLSQIRALDMPLRERFHHRTHIMYLWMTHVISTSFAGLVNAPHHFLRIARLDPYALLCLPPATLIRLGEVCKKLLAKSCRAKKET